MRKKCEILEKDPERSKWLKKSQRLKGQIETLEERLTIISSERSER